MFDTLCRPRLLLILIVPYFFLRRFPNGLRCKSFLWMLGWGFWVGCVIKFFEGLITRHGRGLQAQKNLFNLASNTTLWTTKERENRTEKRSIVPLQWLALTFPHTINHQSWNNWTIFHAILPFQLSQKATAFKIRKKWKITNEKWEWARDSQTKDVTFCLKVMEMNFCLFIHRDTSLFRFFAGISWGYSVIDTILN